MQFLSHPNLIEYLGGLLRLEILLNLLSADVE
jgi:hypothetical protein